MAALQAPHLSLLSNLHKKREVILNSKLEEFKLLVDDNRVWLDEILIEVKKSFTSSDVQTLPKTPSAKRARKRRKATYVDSEDDFDNGPAAKTRNTRSRATRNSPMDTDESLSTSAPETGRTTRSSRAEKAGSKGRSTRSTRNHKKSSSPVMNLLKVNFASEDEMPVIVESAGEVSDTGNSKSPAKKSAKRSLLLKSPEIVSETRASSGAKELAPKATGSKSSENAHPEPPVSKTVTVLSGAQHGAQGSLATCHTPKDAATDSFTGLKKTPKSIPKNTANSPRYIPGFGMLNVKEQAKAYEQMVANSSSDEATPKKKLPTKKPTTVSQSLYSDSDYGTPGAISPSAVFTPAQTPEVASAKAAAVLATNTPPAVTYSTKATVVLSSENTQKVKSRIIKQVLGNATSSPASSVLTVTEPPRRRSSVRKSINRRASNVRLSCRASLKNCKKSLSKRKSSILHRQAPKPCPPDMPDAAVSLESDAESQHTEGETDEDDVIIVSPKIVQIVKETVPGTLDAERERKPSSRLRLKKSHRDTPTKDISSPAKRMTRTKTRQMASSTASLSSEDGVFQSPGQAPAKSTRTKTRQKLQSASSSSSCKSQSSPPAQSRRITRSKVRPTNSATDVSGSQSDDNKFQVPGVPQSKSSRTKTRKRQRTYSGESSQDEQVGHKRRKSTVDQAQKKQVLALDSAEEDEHTDNAASSDAMMSSDDENSHPGKAFCHTPVHASSFLHMMNKKGSSSGSGKRMVGNLNGLVSSFINRTTPTSKTTMEKREEQKKELLLKKRRQEERVQKIKEQRHRELEMAKRKREEHMKMVLARKQKREKELSENTIRTIEKTNVKLVMLQQRELKEKAEREKQLKMKKKKMMEMEEVKSAKEKQSQQEILEKQEEEKRYQEMMLRKRECEEKERAQKLLEEKRQAEAKKRETELQRAREQEQLHKQLEEQEKQRRKEQEEREKQIAKERAEKLRQEVERQKERERQEKEERLKEQARLRQQLAEQKARQDEEERQKKEKLKQISKPPPKSAAAAHSSLNTSSNSIYQQKGKLDRTFEKEKCTTPQSKYRSDNYNIEDMKSDDSTDDEEKPRKEIPTWATGASLKASLLGQYYHPPDIDEIFGDMDDPDLTVMFNNSNKKRRYKKRTSSAIWDSPLYKSPKGACAYK